MGAFKELRLADDMIGGLSAGIIGTVIGYPLDMVKTRMQTSKSSGASNSITRVASQIVRTEGIFALYKGVAPPLVSLSILNTLNFTMYSFFRDAYRANSGWDIRNGIAGSSVGPFASMVSTVENLVKTQMQLDNVSKRQYTGSLHCVRSLVRGHGASILFTGHFINSARETTFLTTYFFMYEGLREVLASGTNQKVAVPIAGGLAGAIAWFVSFPLDCVRAGVQGQNLDSGSRIRAAQVFTTLLKEKGVRGLYSGVTPSIARAFLVSGSRFSAYEGALWLLRGGKSRQEISAARHAED